MKNERSESSMKWKKYLNMVVNLIMSALFITLIFSIFLIVSSKASGEEPNFFGYQLKTVLSGSMEPKFKTGSIIAIRLTDVNDQFNKNEIITFRTKENILVTHRIVDVQGNEYITKGDSNDGADVEPVLSQNIIGKYTGFTIPYIGYAMNFANSKLGSALLLIIPGLYLIGYSIYTISLAFRQVGNSTNNEC